MRGIGRSTSPSRRPPPGSDGLPLIGETLEWRRDPLGFLRRRYERHGRIFRSRVYGLREITLLGPEANEFILSSHRHLFEWRGAHEHFFARKLFGKNLFLLDGAEHERHRKFVLPAFGGGAVPGYFGVIHPLARARIRRWTRQRRVAVFPEMRRLTFEIAARILLGADSGERVSFLADLFHDLIRGMTAFPRLNLPWTAFGRARRAARKLRAHFGELLVRGREVIRRDSALGMLLESRDAGGGRLSDEDVITHVITLLSAAHDTTTSSLTWLVYELSRHADIVARLRRELDETLSGSDLDLESLSRLRYHDLVIKEVERFHPAVTGAPRRVVESFDFDGYHVPAGSIVYYSILFTHRMPEVFRDPDRFDPERFAPPRSEDRRTPFGLIGFGGGPRSCIGRKLARTEMKIILANLVRECEWHVLPDQNLEATYSPTKCPRDGLRAVFTERKQVIHDRRLP